MKRLDEQKNENYTPLENRVDASLAEQQLDKTHTPQLSTDIRNLADGQLEKQRPLPNQEEAELSTGTETETQTEIYTQRKHSMDYFTSDGVILRTGYSDKYMWYLLCIRELIDNAADFLTKYYKGANDAMIIVQITKDDDYFKLKITNSNPSDILVFQNKAAIFDYDMRYGSKQDVHIITRGMLGDAMKQILAFGYILIHVYDDGTSEDQQWNHPLIIRHNKHEYKILLDVDKIRQNAIAGIEEADAIDSSDTQIELTLPIIDEVRSTLTKQSITDFCRKYPIFTTDLNFRFEVTDTSTPPRNSNDITNVGTEANKEEVILNALNNLEFPEATTVIEYAALHPISSEVWNRQNSIHSYTLDEFKRRIVNIDRDQAAKTKIYEVLKTYREGNVLKKTTEYEMTVAELLDLSDSELYKSITNFYYQLKKALPPPNKLTLPYTGTKQERKETLIARLETLYPNILNNDHNKASYKAVSAFYEDHKRKISFPYFLEILAVPVADPIHAKEGISYFGTVNYSMPSGSQGIVFEGDYERYFIDSWHRPHSILGVLEAYRFDDDAEDSSKVPCYIIANLVTPRRDPHGQDKARIDTTPFVDAIVKAVSRLASEIKSYRGEGIYFSTRSERSTTVHRDTGRGQLERLVVEYLTEHHGLPAEAAA